MNRIAILVALGLWLAAPSGVAVAAAAKPVVGDIRFERKTKGDEDFPPAVFPHWVHRVNFKCYVCHTKSVGFEMKAGSAAVTMDLIEEGKYCGTCHNGKRAFGVSFETCTRCHRK